MFPPRTDTHIGYTEPRASKEHFEHGGWIPKLECCGVVAFGVRIDQSFQMGGVGCCYLWWQCTARRKTNEHCVTHTHKGILVGSDDRFDSGDGVPMGLRLVDVEW